MTKVGRSSVGGGRGRSWLIRRKARLRRRRGRGLGHLSVVCHDDHSSSIFLCLYQGTKISSEEHKEGGRVCLLEGSCSMTAGCCGEVWARPRVNFGRAGRTGRVQRQKRLLVSPCRASTMQAIGFVQVCSQQTTEGLARDWGSK